MNTGATVAPGEPATWPLAEADRLEEELELLQQATFSVTEASDVTAAVQALLDQVCARTNWAYGGAWLAGTGDALVASPAWSGDRAALAGFRAEVQAAVPAMGEGLIGTAWVVKRPTTAPAAGRFGMAAVVPVLAGGDVVAVLHFLAEPSQAIDPGMLRMVALVAANVGVLVRRKQAEDRLAAAVAELERSNADLAEFAYVASHDLSEPLRVIAGHAQLLAARYAAELDERAHEHIGFVVDGCARMRSLIDDLLLYSHAGAAPVCRRPVDVAGTVGAVTADLAVPAGTVVTADEGVSVSADPTQLRQVLANLVGNAVKFARPGVPARVHVSVAEKPGAACVTVADNGIGIPERHRERVFRMFQRLHQRDAYPGTGIGLALCRKVVDRHGGRIWCDDAPGGGTAVSFTLPGGGE